MDILQLIKERRSVREFLDKKVSQDNIKRILEAGRWAPSGRNNQPWKFFIVTDKNLKKKLAEQTHYGNIIRNSPVSIVVFLDHLVSYDRTKDVQSIGACIQNMLLEAHSLGLGTCWLGEILKNKEKVNKIFNISEDKELMAVIVLGYPTNTERKSCRRDIKDILL
ncbi:MAG TPA: nitroreductase family protein [Candidatus Altiarchaeales archaeon]|nr:nitroreductase family protein [Candidatus Altiarchaeales archaeon]